MLELNAINDEPLPAYTFGSSLTATSPGAGTDQREAYNIKEFHVSRSDNSIELSKRGFTGARYNFVDTTTGRQEKVDFHILDVYKDLVERKLLDGLSDTPLYDYRALFDDSRMDEFASREITTYITSGQYQDFNDYGSYHEAVTPELCRNKVVAKSLRHWLHKSPLTIVVPGRNFLKRNNNMTLGNKIRVMFISASERTGSVRDILDLKKTGSYLINSATHTFIGQTTDQSYTVTLNLVRLGGAI
jgi:hypothetical protein